MSFTYDTANNIGKVRAIVGDTASATALLSDEQINVFLSLQSNDLFLTAAMALRSMASSKAVVGKLKAAGNYTEDSRQITKNLLDCAAQLEEAAKAVPADAQAEIIHDNFSYNNLIQNKILRNEPLD